MRSNIKVIEKDLLQNLNSCNNFVVHSVYKNVVNLSNEQVILSIQNKCIPKTPMSLVIEDTMDYTTLALKVNEKVYWDNRKISIGTNTFTLSSYEVWNSKLHIYINIYEHNIFKIIGILNNVIKNFGTLDGFGKMILNYNNYSSCNNTLDEFSSIARTILHNTALSLSKHRIVEASMEIKKLIGMGLGLTPSGDDFLIGLLSVLYSYDDKGSGTLLFLNSLKENILKDLNKTNFISGEFLRYASYGRFSETFHNLLGSIKTENHSKVYIDAIKFLKVGHSSGTDGLSGILFGFYLIKEVLLCKNKDFNCSNKLVD